MTTVRRSKVEPEDPAWVRWVFGAFILFAGGVLGGIAVSFLPGGVFGISVAIAVLIGAGILAGRQARLAVSPGGAIATLLLPVPAAAGLWLIMLPFAEGDPEVDRIAVGLYLGWLLVLVLTAAGMAAQRRRALERLSSAGWPPQDLDLAEATALGRAYVLVTDYPATAWGRARLADDRRRLAAHGYVLVELEADEGAQPWARNLDLISPFPLPGLDTTSGPALTATFKQTSLAGPATASGVPWAPDAHGAGGATRTTPRPERRAGRRGRSPRRRE